MFKRCFTVFIFLMAMLPVFAEDAVFSNSETQTFSLQPLDYSTKPIVNAVEDTSRSYSQKRTQSAFIQSNSSNSSNYDMSDQNFMKAINNLDNAQVTIREQMSTYNALMVQAKTEYEAKKEEYKGYKHQYSLLQKRMKNIEKSKKLIQGNVNVQNYSN